MAGNRLWKGHLVMLVELKSEGRGSPCSSQRGVCSSAGSVFYRSACMCAHMMLKVVPRSPISSWGLVTSKQLGIDEAIAFAQWLKLCLTLCNIMSCSAPGFPVLHHLLEFAQTHVHWVGDAIQPSHLLSAPSSLGLNLSQHQGLFQWVGFLNHMAKVSELQLQHWSFQWIFRADFL